MFLLNYHIENRSFWITRHGESMWNTEDRIGGDSNLSPKGEKYARALAKFGNFYSLFPNIF
jgi:broad specificity phosphatase PhoE